MGTVNSRFGNPYSQTFCFDGGEKTYAFTFVVDSDTTKVTIPREEIQRAKKSPGRIIVLCDIVQRGNAPETFGDGERFGNDIFVLTSVTDNVCKVTLVKYKFGVTVTGKINGEQVVIHQQFRKYHYRIVLDGGLTITTGGKNSPYGGFFCIYNRMQRGDFALIPDFKDW